MKIDEPAQFMHLRESQLPPAQGFCFPSEIPAQPGKDGLPGLGVFSLLWGSAFGATAHDAAHDAFMTLPHHTRTREGEVHHLGCGPQSCRVGLCVRKCPHVPSMDGNIFISVLEHNK